MPRYLAGWSLMTVLAVLVTWSVADLSDLVLSTGPESISVEVTGGDSTVPEDDDARSSPAPEPSGDIQLEADGVETILGSSRRGTLVTTPAETTNVTAAVEPIVAAPVGASTETLETIDTTLPDLTGTTVPEMADMGLPELAEDAFSELTNTMQPDQQGPTLLDQVVASDGWLAGILSPPTP